MLEVGARSPVFDLHTYLAGTWWVERVIEDRRGPGGRFTGEARFTGDGPDGLLYEESGIMQLGAWQGLASRRYHWRLCGAAEAMISHGDGSPFHRLDWTEPVAEALHLCGPDRYQGRYRRLGPDLWDLTWRITGPRKDLVLTTTHRRAVAAPAPAC